MVCTYRIYFLPLSICILTAKQRLPIPRRRCFLVLPFYVLFTAPSDQIIHRHAIQLAQQVQLIHRHFPLTCFINRICPLVNSEFVCHILLCVVVIFPQVPHPSCHDFFIHCLISFLLKHMFIGTCPLYTKSFIDYRYPIPYNKHI